MGGEGSGGGLVGGREALVKRATAPGLVRGELSQGPEVIGTYRQVDCWTGRLWIWELAYQSPYGF